MTTSTSYDVIIIGAGPAGEACAAHIARAGGSVVVIERELVGGECAYWGCMPSKALLRPGEVLSEAHRTRGVAEVTAETLDLPAVLARRDESTRELDDSSHTG
ncbi:MAG: FAD-dependent oxidoreductase, partial [Gaiellales bacterium]